VTNWCEWKCRGSYFIGLLSLFKKVTISGRNCRHTLFGFSLSIPYFEHDNIYIYRQISCVILAYDTIIAAISLSLSFILEILYLECYTEASHALTLSFKQIVRAHSKHLWGIVNLFSNIIHITCTCHSFSWPFSFDMHSKWWWKQSAKMSARWLNSLVFPSLMSLWSRGRLCQCKVFLLCLTREASRSKWSGKGKIVS